MISSPEEALLVLRSWEANSSNVRLVFFSGDWRSHASFVGRVSLPDGLTSVTMSGEDKASAVIDLSVAEFGFATPLDMPAEFIAEAEAGMDSAIVARQGGSVFGFFALSAVD
jgi:hypothetical protein